jgi:Ca2+-binding RTX toxin-like protein
MSFRTLNDWCLPWPAVKTLAFLAPVALALAAPALAAAPTVPSDSQPWWGPNGRAIAFQRESPTLESSDVLFTPAVRGSEVDIIGEGRPRGFRPGPTGSGGGELLVEVGATTSIRDATDRELGTVGGTDATWSPDGTRIAYISGDTLWIADAAGKDPRAVETDIVSSAADAAGPVWSADGSEIAVSTATELLAVAADGSGARSLYVGDNTNPSWSFDGSEIAFEHSVSGRLAIWVADRSGDAAHELVGGAANNRFPQWSATADRLAFLSDRGGRYALYVETGDAAPQKLVDAVRPDSPPRWSPDGTQLAVAAAPECRRFGIYVADAQGRGRPLRRSNQCRLDGTGGGDVINGTPYLDIIHGFGGNDFLFAAGGDDVIDGGAGNDRIGGGRGNDVIYGGPGNDTLTGGIGDDTIYAGPGHDKVGCGPGNDTAYIGSGDTVRHCEHVHKS